MDADADPQRIVIAGGGTAGWMVAAALGQLLSRGFQVTLVEADDIPTVGVGEATIPQLRLFHQALGLDEDAMLRACGGTFKLGIEFVGWGAEGERYLHAFGDVGRDVGPVAFQHYWHRARVAGAAGPLGDYSLNALAAQAGRMHRGAPVTAASVPAMPYAFHLDAGRYAGWLRRFAGARGVARREGRIVGVERGEAGVAALRLADGERVAGDLFVDCTGFRALLAEALGAGWEDWSRWLPCDRAVALPTSGAGEPIPFTQASAHRAGWRWRIPLQHRAGNGLVYAAGAMGDDEAADTLRAAVVGEALAEPRVLRFGAGRRRRAWVGNVVAVGLASGFLEPLESTSIHLVQSAIERLVKLLPGRAVTPAARDAFNRRAAAELEGVRDFLILHYHASRRPEPFWREVRAVPPPAALADRIELYRATGQLLREGEELFTEVGWLQVLEGQGLSAQAHSPLADMIPAADLAEFMAAIPALYRREAARYPTHAAFLAQHCRAAPI